MAINSLDKSATEPHSEGFAKVSTGQGGRMRTAIGLEALDNNEFLGIERSRDGWFRWSRQSFGLAAPASAPAYLMLSFASPLPHNRLRVQAGDEVSEVELYVGW